MEEKCFLNVYISGSETAESIHPEGMAKGRNSEVLSPTGTIGMVV